MVTRFFTTITVVLLSLGTAQAQSLVGDEPSYLDFGFGAFNAVDGNGSRPVPEVQTEFRYGQKVLFIGPTAGIAVNSRHGFSAYGGLYSDVAFGPIVVTPFAGIAAYHQGDGKDLGDPFEFRLSLSARYQLSDGSRIGLQFAHVSNAYAGRINPGDEEVLFTYAVPLNF